MRRSKSILAGGDYLPLYRKAFTESGEETTESQRPKFKDGVTPGQEWNQFETAAIRALANPALATDAKASKASGIGIPKIRKLKRNPHFMNAVYELSTDMLLRYKVQVDRALIRAARRGSFQDRQLYYKLIGLLRDERKVVKHETLDVRDVTDDDLGERLLDDVDALSDHAPEKLAAFSRRTPGGKGNGGR